MGVGVIVVSASCPVWIPAFAGMTVGWAGMTGGVGWIAVFAGMMGGDWLRDGGWGMIGRQKVGCIGRFEVFFDGAS